MLGVIGIGIECCWGTSRRGFFGYELGIEGFGRGRGVVCYVFRMEFYLEVLVFERVVFLFIKGELWIAWFFEVVFLGSSGIIVS